MRKFAPRGRRGFTLVELLVVVLIIAILAAIALPLYLSAVADSELKTARSNMQTIANAMQAYKVRSSGHTYPTALSQLTSDLGRDFSSTTPAAPGPGTRTYAIVTAGTGCTDGNGNAVTVPSNSFGIDSSYAPDGCFIPGVTSN